MSGSPKRIEMRMRSLIPMAALLAITSCSDTSRAPMYFDCTMKLGARHIMMLNLVDKTASIDWGFYAERRAESVHDYEVIGVTDEQIVIGNLLSGAGDYRERRISRIDGRFVGSIEGLVSKSTGVCKQIDDPYGERAF